MKAYPVQKVLLKNGETYAYRRAGNGPKTLLLLHGNLSSSLHWQSTMESLKKDYTVIAPDLRGFGDSTYHARFDSLGELAGDVGLLADALNLEEFYLLGWSAGGGVAMELAADRPGQVQGLILLASVPPTGYPMYAKDDKGQPIPTKPLSTKEDVACDPVQVLPVQSALKNGDRGMMRYLWELTIYNVNKPSDADFEVYLDGIMKQRCLVDLDYALLSFNMTGQDTAFAPGSGRLKRIVCPVTVLQGEKDLVVPLGWGQSTVALLGAKMVTFPNAGHAPMTDAPDAFWQSLRCAMEG